LEVYKERPKWGWAGTMLLKIALSCALLSLASANEPMPMVLTSRVNNTIDWILTSLFGIRDLEVKLVDPLFNYQGGTLVFTYADLKSGPHGKAKFYGSYKKNRRG
jgi:hypothetical protein